MLTVKLFGAASVVASGQPITGRAAQGLRLALLAVLALARGRPVTRDKLTALLWPESTTERARHQLSDTLYIIRAALGEDAVRSSGDELLLNPDAAETDVGTFERLLDEGRLEPAVELFAGPLLDGFHLVEGAEFEHWLDRERARLDRRYAEALEALGEASERRDQFAVATGWWRRLATHDPYIGRVASRLMRALEASGDRAGALQHARVHAALLRQEFDAGPDPEVDAFAERLRLDPPARTAPEPAAILAVDGGAEPLTDVEPETSAPADSGPAPPIRLSRTIEEGKGAVRRRRSLVAAAIVAFLFLVGTAWAVLLRDVEPERSIIVLPFIDLSPDQENEYFSDGLTEEIISRLAGVPELKVISRTSAMHYKGSKASLRQIAGELNVAHVLEGSVRQSDGRMRVSAQLIDARGDEHLWAANYEYELQDVFRVQEEIAGQVVQALEIKLGEHGRRMLAKQSTRDPEAYQLYRRGQFLWRSRFYEGHRQAIEYYRKAIERDSSYTDAYAGLAEIQFVAQLLHFSSGPEAEAYSRLKWAAERALALDDESADAHASFASALWWNRNWPGAAREFRRALELNPSHPMARSWLSLLLGGMGRGEEALQESRRAATLDPLSIVVSCNYGWQCYMSREYDCAIRQYRQALEIAPNYGTAWRGLGLTYAQRGMFPEAIDALRKAADRAPGYLGDLAYAQALTGDTESARATLARAKAEPQNGFSIARVYVALDMPDSAFAWLERSSWRWPHEANRADPALDPLRSDPRFAKLVVRVDREMGLQ